MILFRADATAVLENDLLHDRESQTRAAVAPRKVWLKQPSKVFRFDSLPGVREFRTYETALDVMTRDDRNAPFLNREQCLDRVIDQVHEDALELLHVEQRRRQV